MKFWIFFLLLFGTLSCHKNIYTVRSIENKSTRIDQSMIHHDAKIDQLIAPYKKSMDSTMNEIIAIAPYNLDKKNPESLLGNWVTDAMKWYLDSVAHIPCDIAVCNYGGLRIKALSKGNIQLKHVFELMPFDNAITLITVE